MNMDLNMGSLGFIKLTDNFPLNSFGSFILASLNFSNLSEFSQVTESMQHYNKIFANFYTWICINWHIFSHEFANIKYTLNQFLWNLLKLSDDNLKRPKFISMLASPRLHEQFHACTTKNDILGLVVFQQIHIKIFGKKTPTNYTDSKDQFVSKEWVAVRITIVTIISV